MATPLKWPATHSPSVKSMASRGLENVEKKSATAVASINCTPRSAIGTSRRRSSAGARQPCLIQPSVVHVI